MRTTNILALLLTLSSATPSIGALKVHEWGTFTSLVGSDGQTQNGMYHEDERLPNFVHPFGVVNPIGPVAGPAPTPTPQPPPDDCIPNSKLPCEFMPLFETNVVSQKMETPVIYFYSDRAMDVSVNVKFPEGLITETFPAPVKTSPGLQNLSRIKGGDTTFRVQTHPTKFAPPLVPPGNIYGHARNVNSDPIRSLGAVTEDEHFIFYRGLGRFQPRLDITSKGGAINIVAPSPADQPRAAFLVYVNQNGGSAMISAHERIQAGRGFFSEREVDSLRAYSGTNHTQSTRGILIKHLTGAGLNLDEAVAMIDTWEHGYLKVPGLRLLYILPRQEVEKILPMTVSPVPDELERVFVGRLEILTENEEESILTQIRRERGQFNVSSLGRFAEAKLRRIEQILVGRKTPVADFELMRELIARAKAGEGGVLN